MPKQDDVTEIYKGVNIRKSNVVRIRIGARKFKELIDEVEKTKLSMPKIIWYSGKPCNHCKGISVIVFNNEDEEVSVRRGILSDYTLMNSGTNIIKQNNTDCNEKGN